MKPKRKGENSDADARVPDGLGRQFSNRRDRPAGRRMRRVLRIVVPSLLAGALIAAAWFIARSPLLRVAFVVTGAPPATHERIVSALSALAVAESPTLGMLGPNHLFVWIAGEPTEVRVRIDTMLIAATPKLSAWDRRVDISATVRSIAGVWCAASDQGSCYGFDEEGVLLAEVPRTEGTLLTVITDESSSPRVLGQRILPNSAWIQRLTETLAAVRESGERVARISVREVGLHEWAVRLASGPILEFSFDFVPDDLAATLRKLKLEVSFDGLEGVDFRVPGRLYYR